MDFYTKILIVLVVVAVLARHLPTLVLWFRLRRLPIGGERHEAADPFDVPEDYLVILRDAEEVLGRLGFAYAHIIRQIPPPGMPTGDEFIGVFHDRVNGVCASVKRSEAPGSGESFDLTLATHYPDGTVVRTARETTDAFFPLPPAIDCRYVRGRDAAGILEEHRRHVAEAGRGRTPLLHDPAAHVREAQAEEVSTTAHWAAQGLLRMRAPGGPGRLNAASAWRIAVRMARLNRPAARVARREPGTPEAQAANVSAHVLLYRRAQALRSLGASTGKNWLWLLVSIAFFMLSFRLQMSMKFVIILTLVVLVHEAGHLAGMALFGYRDRRMLFLPFLGGVALGRKDNVEPWKEFVVLLLGPLPGIVAGTAMLVWNTWGGAHQLLLEAASMALAVNLLNMLPVLPLDGGRMLECTLIARWPLARFVFHAISVLVLAAAGLTAGMGLLTGLAALMALSLHLEWKIARAARELRPACAARADEAGRLRGVFTRLTTGACAGMILQQRMAMADRLVTLLSARRPGVALGVLGVFIYLGVWLLPLGGVVAVGIGMGLTGRSAAGLIVAAAPTPEARFDACLAAAQLEHARHKDAEAEQYLLQAATLAEQGTNAAAGRARIDLRRALFIADPEAARSAIRRVLDRAPADAVGPQLRADLLYEAAGLYDRFDAGERLELAREAATLYQSAPACEARLVEVRCYAAACHAELAQWDSAIAECREAMKTAGASTNELLRAMRGEYATTLAGYECEAGRPDAADATLRDALAEPERNSDDRASLSARRLLTMRAWLAVERKDYEAAEGILRPLLTRAAATKDRWDSQSFLRADTALDLCHVCLLSGRPEEARALWGAHVAGSRFAAAVAGARFEEDDDEDGAAAGSLWQRRQRAHRDVILRFGAKARPPA